MVSDTLAYVTRAAHDLGLATWFGGSMFGKLAHNPSVKAISDPRERGKVVTAVATGIANGVQGARLARQAREGAVPVENGTEPAPETPAEAASIQRSLD